MTHTKSGEVGRSFTSATEKFSCVEGQGVRIWGCESNAVDFAVEVKGLVACLADLESAMRYSDATASGIVPGARIWDSIVSGRGDISFPRLMRVQKERMAGKGEAFYLLCNGPAGLYSGRIRVSYSNKAWKLVNTGGFLEPGRGSCFIEIVLYGLLFVNMSSPVAPRRRVLFGDTRMHVNTQMSGFSTAVCDVCKSGWDSVASWLDNADSDNTESSMWVK